MVKLTTDGIAEQYQIDNRLSRSSVREWEAVKGLLEELPFKPESIGADADCGVGLLREHFDTQGINSYIPFNQTQITKRDVYRGRFAYRGDHLICPQGMVRKRDPCDFHNAKTSPCEGTVRLVRSRPATQRAGTLDDRSG